jgi:protein phosphatase
MSTTLPMAGHTDPGRIREQNEDSIATWPEMGLAILADGMGGHLAGEVASRLAVDVISRHMLDVFAKNAPDTAGGTGQRRSLEARTLHDAIELANAAIYGMAHDRPECEGMGSTIVVAVFFNDKVCVGHVGDSRLYRLRQGKLEHLTQDHSVIEELVSRGLLTREEARLSIGKNLVTRALGVDPFVATDISESTRLDGDLYLLCSDGLNDVIGDEEIEQILAGDATDLEDTARRLVEVANARGGPDNISVILARPGEEYRRDVEALRRLRDGAKPG